MVPGRAVTRRHASGTVQGEQISETTGALPHYSDRIMLLLWIGGLLGAPGAAQQQAEDESATAAATVELGTVEFDAGPARGSARFYLDRSEPRVDVSVKSDALASLWWRGGGLGCVGSDWLVPPQTVDGRIARLGFQGISCTMERNEPTTEEELELWKIEPATSVEPCRYRPFADWGEPAVEVSPLERWAWRTEFSLPRATPPPRSMEFVCATIVLAWSRTTGPRVFLDTEGRVYYPHFDPFAERPFDRGLGPFEIRIGPLRGTATLDFENDWPVVEWTLTNPLDHEIAWSMRGVGSPLAWGFTELEFQEGEADEDAWMHRAEIRRAHGRFAPEGSARFAPGETRTFRLAPFSYDPTSRDDWQRENGLVGLKRWHFVLDSTWPCRVIGGSEPRFLPTRLHFQWDAEVGFDMGIESPGAFLEGSEWRAFVEPRAGGTASFPLGECDAILTSRWQLQVINGSHENLYWLSDRTSRETWLRKPGAEAAEDLRIEEPAPWPATGEPLHPRVAERTLLHVGEVTDASCEPQDSREIGFDASGRLHEQGWELLIPIALPQIAPPAHDRDARRAWLRVRRHPGGTLDAVVHESWPL